MIRLCLIIENCVGLYFGENNFRNEIVWCYRGAGYPKRDFGKRHDVIYRYSKTNMYLFNLDDVREEYSESTKHRFKHYIGNKRNSGDFGIQTLNPKGKHPDDFWLIQPIAPSAKERTGYPTQKPLILIERIIKASSNKGDMVLDPFCGCATTCVAAEKLGRQWMGIDISVTAYELVKLRLKKEVEHKDSMPLMYEKLVKFSTKIPKRTDIGTYHKEKKWVYVIIHPNYPGEFKVGIAKDWKSRLNSYQTSDPERAFEMKYKLETPHFREIEIHIHEKFENKHEWVRGQIEDIIYEIENYDPQIIADQDSLFSTK